MSELEEIREQIAYLKLWLGISIASGISLLGWLFANSQSADRILLFSGLLAIIGIIVGIFLLDRRIRRKIRVLRDL